MHTRTGEQGRAWPCPALPQRPPPLPRSRPPRRLDPPPPSLDALSALQIHISLTGNPTEMRVTWKTAGGRWARPQRWVRALPAALPSRRIEPLPASCNWLVARHQHPAQCASASLLPRSCPSTVTAGPAAALAVTPPDAARLRSHRGSQHSYSPGDTCAAPARTFRYGETYLHTAVLTGLSPGRRHFYQVNSCLVFPSSFLPTFLSSVLPTLLSAGRQLHSRIRAAHSQPRGREAPCAPLSVAVSPAPRPPALAYRPHHQDTQPRRTQCPPHPVPSAD
jgi:hypothetical protein